MSYPIADFMYEISKEDVVFNGLPNGVTQKKAAEILKKLNINLAYSLEEMVSGKKGINLKNKDELFSLVKGGCGFTSLRYALELTETGREYIMEYLK